MKDRFEEFVNQNKPQFDESFNADKGWQGINDKINQPTKTRSFNWFAAASIVLLLAVGWLVIDRISLNQKVTALEQVAVEGRSYSEIENYYTQQISLKSAEVKKKGDNIDYPLAKDVKTLQAKYETLKVKLKEKGPNEQIINAMILNLRTQIELLNEQLSIIEDINNYMNTENNKNNEKQI
jgi:hypothetical protein